MPTPHASDPIKVQIVGLVDSNYPDSWRTRQDYIDDQRQQRNLVRLQAGTLIAAVAGLVVSSYLQYQSSKEKQTVVVEVVHKHVQVPLDAAPASSPSGSRLGATPTK